MEVDIGWYVLRLSLGLGGLVGVTCPTPNNDYYLRLGREHFECFIAYPG